MHTPQDYTIFQYVDEELDRFPVGNNWINESFLLGPVYLGLSQLMNSAKIKTLTRNRLTLLF